VIESNYPWQLVGLPLAHKTGYCAGGFSPDYLAPFTSDSVMAGFSICPTLICYRTSHEGTKILSIGLLR
jgi:hypothetical protein